MELQLVTINDYDKRIWESVLLSKRQSSDEFIFKNKELNDLCDGAFSSWNVEIEEVFGRVVRFRLVRETSQLFVNLLFTEEISAQFLFRETRSHQKLVSKSFTTSSPPSPPTPISDIG